MKDDATDRVIALMEQIEALRCGEGEDLQQIANDLARKLGRAIGLATTAKIILTVEKNLRKNPIGG